MRTLNKDRTVFMYTQYTAIREIKDRTVFMYIQYTVKYEIIRNDGILCSGADFTILFGGDDILIIS